MSINLIEKYYSGVTFDPDNFSNGEIVARLGIPRDSQTPIFTMLESMKTALAEIKTSTRGSDSGVESSALEQVKGLVAAKASSVDVEALRTSVEGELDRLAQQLTSVDQRFLAMEAQIRTTSLENIIDDCFPNDLIENKSLSVVFAGDASFVLKDGDGEFTIQGGEIPYGLFSADASGQQKQVGLLIAKPEDRALRVLRVLFGLSQAWIDANITEVDDLGTIVPSVFDYVLGTGRDGKGTFKGAAVTDSFSKNAENTGTVSILGKATIQGGSSASSVSSFFASLGVKPQTDDVKRFRVLCKYLLTTK